MKITGSEKLAAVFHMGYLAKARETRESTDFKGEKDGQNLKLSEEKKEKQRADKNTAEMQKSRCMYRIKKLIKTEKPRKI